jgi:8-oxo-dGTP diphosphatase
VQLIYCPRCATRIELTPPGRCRACDAEFYANPKPCAGALVERDRSVLLLRRAIAPGLGEWDIPGGFCEEHEHPEATARRETREETGLDVRLTELLGMWIDTYGDGDQPESTLNIYYRAVPTDSSQEPHPLPEASEFRWFSPEALPSKLAFEHAREALDAWQRIDRR